MTTPIDNAPVRPWIALIPMFLFLPLLALNIYVLNKNSGWESWPSAEAEVIGTVIRSERPGTPMWAVSVDYKYEVNSRSFQSRDSVFHAEERPEAVAEQAKWPAGKKFTIYHHPDDPSGNSLNPGGDFEALTVVTVLFGMIAGLLTWIFYLARKKEKRRLLRIEGMAES